MFNVKGRDDVPHDAISAARPQAIYLKPVVPRITSRSQFKEEHISEYKLKNMGVPTVTQQRLALGLTPHKLLKQLYNNGIKKVGHDGGKQPLQHVKMRDDDFVSGLLSSGIPLDQLDQAFKFTSPCLFNKVLRHYLRVPEVACNLNRLTRGTQISGGKFTRIKPLFSSFR